LNDLNVNYRVPPVEGLESDRVTLDDRVSVSLSTPMADAEIRYTTDGSDPTEESRLYRDPFDLPVDEEGVTITARTFTRNNGISAPAAATFRRTSLRPADDLATDELQRGAHYAYYEGRFSTVEQLTRATPSREGVARNIELPGFERDDFIGLQFTGYIRVPTSGVYSFYLTSDDGSRLTIGGEIVIDHDGFHRATERTGVIALETGYHPFMVGFFHAGGSKALRLTAQREGDDRPASIKTWLFHVP
jgi:hexosaminidase